MLDFVGTRLARFKCPTVVEIVGDLPHSVTGKVSKGSPAPVSKGDVALSARVILIGKPGCHLCDVAREVVETVRARPTTNGSSCR